jgi:polyhydroxyalkanoate synthesis regulator phasin
MKKILLAAILIVTVSSCERKQSFDKVKVADVEMAPPAEKNLAAADYASADANVSAPVHKNANDVSKKIIKEGDISFETGNIYASRDIIHKSLTKLGGYVAEENEANNSDNGRKEYTLKARIPANNFDAFVNSVSSAAARIDTKNIRTKDVTTEYIDITTQLANKKKLENSYLELLKRGDKIADLLQIENKLTELQTDIETTQGQLNYLLKQVDYSSLDITFYSRQLIKDDGQNFSFKLKSALSDGWDILSTLFFGVIGLWPIWIILAAFYFIFKAWRKRHPMVKKVVAAK